MAAAESRVIPGGRISKDHEVPACRPFPPLLFLASHVPSRRVPRRAKPLLQQLQEYTDLRMKFASLWIRRALG